MKEDQHITFYAEDIDFDTSVLDSCLLWLSKVAEMEGSKIDQLTYIFCSDEYLLQINKEYLDHDYYTDIITFPYRQGAVVESDLFISIDRIRDHASTYGVTFEHELRRVIVHGLLHLIGYDDKTVEDQTIMTNMEDKYLDFFGTINP